MVDLVLQLSLHPLDLSSEKTKASVGRSIGWRRPPTRVARVQGAERSAVHQQDAASSGGLSEERVEIQVQDEKAPQANDDIEENESAPIISFPSDDDSTEKATSIISSSSQRTSSRHSIVESRKSCSSENLVKLGAGGDVTAAEEGPGAGLWARSSVLRRSLQYTRPPDFPTGTSVRRMREEIEARGVGVKGVASAPQQTPSPQQPKEMTIDKVKRLVSDSIATQNHSFVTVKSLKEVRGRLRSKASPEDVVPVTDAVNGEDSGDVILSEDHVLRRAKDPAPLAPSPAPRVQSYMFGMDAKAQHSAAVDSTSTNKTPLLNGLRSEEWYRRRKSYGFELDLPQSEDVMSLKENKEDSRSDSGSTFRSSVFLPVLKHLDGMSRMRPASLYDSQDSQDDNKEATMGFTFQRVGEEMTAKTTVVSLVDSGRTTDMDRRRDVLRRRAEREITKQAAKQGAGPRRLTEPVSVSIPVVSDDSFTVRSDDHAEGRGAEPTLLINGFHHSDGESSATKTSDLKRHSIALVEGRNTEEEDTKTDATQKMSHADHVSQAYLSDSTEDSSQSRKKRVEFSKTEVHFAAEPGRFNLVSTDDKPPPTNIVRGRRRKLLAEQRFNKSGLPEVRFGDSPFEQKVLTVEGGTHENTDEPKISTGAVITVTMEGKLSPEVQLSNERIQPFVPTKTLENNGEGEKSRGIIRCMINGEQDINSHCGVPMWRSTVTLKNNSFTSPTVIVNQEKSGGEAEFQKLLKSLRPTGRRDVSFKISTPHSHFRC